MTPALDLLNRRKIAHQIHHYDHDPRAASYGEEAVAALGVGASRVFKTLVVALDNSDSPELGVAVVAVNQQLSLKLAAKAFKCKKVMMADSQLVERVTGYVLGGVSPLGQKKALKTIVDDSAKPKDTIFVSAGKRGLEIEIAPDQLTRLTRGEFHPLSANHSLHR